MKMAMAFCLGLVSWNLYADDGQSQAQLPPPAASTSASIGNSTLHLIPVLGMTDTAIKWNGGGTDQLTGPSLGLYADIGDKRLMFETGLLYNEYGGQDSIQGVDIKWHLDYIGVPLFAKYNLLGKNENILFIKAGLMPSQLVMNTVTTSFDGDSLNQGAMGGVRPFDLPAVIGVGASIYGDGHNSLIIEGSYARSLLNISSTSSSAGLRNEGFTAELGISIAI